jgi:hypothetical protein
MAAMVADSAPGDLQSDRRMSREQRQPATIFGGFTYTQTDNEDGLS